MKTTELVVPGCKYDQQIWLEGGPALPTDLIREQIRSSMKQQLSKGSDQLHIQASEEQICTLMPVSCHQRVFTELSPAGPLH